MEPASEKRLGLWRNLSIGLFSGAGLIPAPNGDAATIGDVHGYVAGGRVKA